MPVLLPPWPADTAPSALLVGYSGGLDSTVLLHLLAHSEWRESVPFRAIHVHHGLHSDADHWAEHCRANCTQLGITFILYHASVEQCSGEGLEAAARRVRHAAFESAMTPGTALVTAHHRDDQAETFLLRALRASGVDGLAAMRDWRPFARGGQWRPLLHTPRAALLAYAQHHNLCWINDPSNASIEHDRNFLRHHIFPLLHERWPQAHAAFARSAALSAEANDLLAEGDRESLALVQASISNTLSIPALMRLPTPRRARVLRRWVHDTGLPSLPAEGVRRIEAELLTARHDAQAAFKWNGALIRRWRDLLHAGPQQTPWPADWQTSWDGRSSVILPVGGSLSLAGTSLFQEPVMVHARQGGERITLSGRPHAHTLKKLLQECTIPPWTRERMPLLSTQEGELLAAGDGILSARFQAWLQQRGARLVWQMDDPPSP